MAGILQLPLMVQELAWTKSEHYEGSTGILFFAYWCDLPWRTCVLSISIFMLVNLKNCY